MAVPGVALIAPPVDAHACVVRAALRDIGTPTVQFDLGTVARHALSVVPGRHLRVGRDEIGPGWAVWWRRGGVNAPTLDLSGNEAVMASCETRDIVLGGLLSLDLRWVDEPFTVMRAAHTLLQLSTAAAAGARVPDTAATNQPDVGRALAAAGPIVAKAISGSGVRVHVDSVSTDDLHLLANAPTCLQRQVTGEADLRVVVVDGEAFCWRRPRTGGSRVDWRTDDPRGTGFAPFTDTSLRVAAVAVNRRLGLSFGVQDWVLDTSGTPVFLEVNPCGAWGFLSGAQALVAPVLARHLAGGEQVSVPPAA
jgi:hypothetical protein